MTLEKIKIEIRSILLSSKSGVDLDDLQNDYEQLTCQQLMFKELGFNDVRSLIRAMPDVAKEVRSPNGQITYHAVCDESTAHIKKLVSNQKSVTKKKKKHPKVREGCTRGSGRGFAAGRGNYSPRGKWAGRGKPRFSTNSGHPGRQYPASSSSSSGFGYNRSASFGGDLSNHNSHFRSHNLNNSFSGRGILDQFRPTSDASDDYPSHLSSNLYNLKIGVSSSGRRFISTFGDPLQNSSSINTNNHNDVSDYIKLGDAREFINKKRSQNAGVSFVYNGPVDKQERIKTLNNESRHRNLPPRTNLAPRFLKMMNSQTGSSTGQIKPVKDCPESRTSTPYFSENNTVYSTERKNWIAPEMGERYLQTYNRYFAERGETAPTIQINSGIVNKQKGFYATIIHNDRYFYPLEIMLTEELARQNVARFFCMENNIPLLTTEKHQIEPTQTKSPNVTHDLHTSLRDQNVSNSNKENCNEAKTSQLQSVNSKPVLTSASHKRQPLPEVLEKIYKMLKPNGIWASKIPDLYKETYGEVINVDFQSLVSQWPDYFTIEVMAGNRFLVYSVSGLTKETEIITQEVTTNKIISVPVPPSLPLPVGFDFQVLFSFAYSPADVYFQKAELENLVYDIEELLNNSCPGYTAPEADSLVLNTLIAANYEDGWYRAQVVALEAPMVTVYFIDYGNRENVSISDLRPIPQQPLTLDTAPLAIKCCIRKSREGEWCQNTTTILTDLTEHNPILVARILENKGDQCVIDLLTPEGYLVNDKLVNHSQALTPTEAKSEPLSAEQVGQQSLASSAVRLFSDEPAPLEVPESDNFVVYVCRVMSENTVLLRIVDDEYSEKLDHLEQLIADNFYSWPVPKILRRSNIYAGMVLAEIDDAEDVEYDEEGKEQCADQNKYHRVRLLRENKDGSCECYLPDHGYDKTLSAIHLREIDPTVNLSLSYQAVMAKLNKLDNLPDSLKPMAVHLLIKLLINGSTFHAINKNNDYSDDASNTDAVIINRVKKIISCMKDVQLSSVTKIYQDVYKESLNNVEEVIKHIPGFGYWKEGLVLELVDSSQEDEDLNVSDFVLATIEEMKIVQSQGGNVKTFLKSMFSSNTSSGDSESVLDDSQDDASKDLQDDQSNLSSNQSISDIEQQLNPETKNAESASQDGNDKPAICKALYTWGTDTKSPAAGDASSSSSHPSSSATTTKCISCLPKFWVYPPLQFVSVQIVRVESPSYFVVVPMEQRGALEKLETAISQYISSNKIEPATNLSQEVLYAVKSATGYHRTLYVNMVGDMVKIFHPDHHFYDTVLSSDLYELPEQFYSLPFLARQCHLGGIVPTGPDWPENVIQWFKEVFNKCLYALITEEEHNNTNSHLSGILTVLLIDTSGSEDLVMHEYMESQGMGVRSQK